MSAPSPRPAAGLAPLDGGARCALVVRAQPRAKKRGYLGLWNGLVRVAVSEPPEDGRANAALADELARLFGLRRAAFRLVSGATAREKRFEIDAPYAAVAAALARLAAGEDAA
jgi:hypothetical protein